MRAPGGFRSTAFGLAIASNVAIPGLRAERPPGEPDVHVHFDQAAWAGRPGRAGGSRWYESPERDDGIPWLTVRKGETFTFDYSEGAIFEVSSDGTRVHAAWAPPLTAHDAASYLLGPVLAFVLRLRGTMPLHASGVVIGGRAVLFMGPAGSGKSSTVAVLGRLGYPVLSDDVVPLRMTETGLVACPAYPRLTIWEDAADAIFGPGAGLPRVSAVYAKHVVDLSERGLPVCDQPVPLDTIFLLDGRTPSGTIEIGAVGGRDGLVALTANAYGGYLLDRELRAREFTFLAEVARRVPLRSLRFEDALDRLPVQCATIAGACARPAGCDTVAPMSS